MGGPWKMSARLMHWGEQAKLEVVNVRPPMDEAFVRLEHDSAVAGENVNVRFWESELVKKISKERRKKSGFRSISVNEDI